MIQPVPPTELNAVIDHYEELDRFYRIVWGEHVHHGLWRSGRERPKEAVEQLIEFVTEQARLRPKEHVCDIGSGYGTTARFLVQRFGVRVTALTLIPVQHAYADAIDPAGNNPVYLLRDWLDNGLPDAVFDVAIAIESTEHMHDKKQAFAEACRVLRPGGRLVVCAWISAERPARWARRFLLEPICREGRLPGMGSELDYRVLLEAAGFSVDAASDLSQRCGRRGRSACGARWGAC